MIDDNIIKENEVDTLLQETDFEILIKISNYLCKLVSDKELPRGFLARTILLAEEVLSHLKNGEINLIPVHRMEYYLKIRNIGDDIKSVIKRIWEKACFSYDIKNNLNKNEGFIGKLVIIKIACKIAQLKTRRMGVEENE